MCLVVHSNSICYVYNQSVEILLLLLLLSVEGRNKTQLADFRLLLAQTFSSFHFPTDSYFKETSFLFIFSSTRRELEDNISHSLKRQQQE